MNLKSTFMLTLTAGVLFTACGTKENAEKATAGTTPQTEATMEAEPANAVEAKEAVVIWPALSVRKEAGSKGKWVTNVYQGEKLTFTGETKTDETKENDVYAKVELSDGTSGWVLDRFIATDAQGAAITNETVVYRRPDLLTQTDKKFSKRSFVVVLEEQDEWVKIKGIPQESNWFTEGWVNKSDLTTGNYDVSFAILANKAEGEEDAAKKEELTKQLMENTAFEKSVFFSEFVAAHTPQEVSDEELLQQAEEDLEAFEEEEAAMEEEESEDQTTAIETIEDTTEEEVE